MRPGARTPGARGSRSNSFWGGQGWWRVIRNTMPRMADAPTLLIADDDPSVIRLLKHELAPLGLNILEAASGDEALAVARDKLPDVALIDVQMPGRSGWDVCQAIKGVARTSSIAVILMTARGDVRDRLTGLQVGADDYLVKPFRREEVLRRVTDLLPGNRKAIRTAIEKATGELDAAMTDPVTCLPTLPLVLDHIRELLIEHEELGIAYIDIEQFEELEERYGWAFFDEFLRQLAEAVREEAVRRFEQFHLICDRPGSPGIFLFYDASADSAAAPEAREQMISELRETLSRALHRRFPNLRTGEIEFFIGGSSIRYRPQIRIERQIYSGMQRAADVVRDAEINRRRILIAELKELVRKKRLTTVFQPIVYASDRSLFGYEILSRGPRHGSFTNSDVLFSFARETNLLRDLEDLALDSAIRRLKKEETAGAKFLLNLEAEMFLSDEFRFNHAMDFFSSYPGKFVFELTERAAIQDYDAFRTLLEGFRQRGVQIAIDDAGSGYASLEAIASLAPDYLKITRSLVSTLPREPIKQDLLRMLVELAQKIGAMTLAEGIETEEEFECCRELGIELIQGYLIARPSEELYIEPANAR